MSKQLIVLLLLLLVGCSSSDSATLTPTPSAPPVAQVPPTTAITPTTADPATATPPPTVAPTAPPTATSLPTATVDQWQAYQQWTVEGLQQREYGGGTLEIVDTLEETANFTRYLVAYPSDGLRITGMLNVPRGEGTFPVVVLNHGYYPLDVYQTGNGTKLAADYLANRGFLTISPDFRSHAASDDAPNQFRAGHVIDVLNLLPLISQVPQAQADQVGMWGHSNGGAITAKAMVISDQLKAAVIYAPASSNITEDYMFRVERAQSRGQVIDPIDWPVAPDQAPDLYERLSPLGYLDNVDIPVLIFYGSADEIVPFKWPDDLRAGLERAGKNVEMIVYEGQPHSFQGQPNLEYLQRMTDFFRQALQP